MCRVWTIDLNKKASVYLPELKHSNKKDFVLKDILTHQSGLFPFVPFWARTMKDSTHLPVFYASEGSAEYPLPVAENLFGRKTLRDSLWRWTIHSKINERHPRVPHEYKYSDMSFYILHHLAERKLNQPMEEFLSKNLYEKLGAYTTTYQPLNKFSASRIAPTEQDRLFRKSLLIGYVHDQGAAMHGGIAGQGKTARLLGAMRLVQQHKNDVARIVHREGGIERSAQGMRDIAAAEIGRAHV